MCFVKRLGGYFFCYRIMNVKKSDYLESTDRSMIVCIVFGTEE